MDSQLRIFTCSAIMLCKYFTPAGQMLGLVSRRHWRAMGGGRGFPFWFSCAYLPGLLQRPRFLLVPPGGQQARSGFPGRFPHHTVSRVASEWRAAGKAPSCERFLWIFCSEFWDWAPEISPLWIASSHTPQRGFLTSPTEATLQWASTSNSEPQSCPLQQGPDLSPGVGVGVRWGEELLLGHSIAVLGAVAVPQLYVPMW